MIDTTPDKMLEILGLQRDFFSLYKTRPISFRIEMLQRLRKAIVKHEQAIAKSLWIDLHKSYEEAFLTEINIVLTEIDNHIRHLKQWAKPKKVSSPLIIFPSKSKIIYEPLGVALIIAPWNYPFQLLINPLIGAISSGCCAILKASPYALETAFEVENIINECFDNEYIAIVQGGRHVNQFLLEQKFDFIFFTGSPTLGKVVMKAAAENLTPVVLELGGKSPCIVDKGADIETAAKRIAWGKTINAGQTCIAPDYLMVHHSVKQKLLKKIQEHFEKMYGKFPEQSQNFGRIINQKEFQRLQECLKDGEIVCGGVIDEQTRYISPTIIDEVKPDFPIMQMEIFGPILPVMTFENIREVVEFVNERLKPLAFYYFGKDKNAKEILMKTTSGGACINDTLLHISNDKLPFGGVGNSGMGKYHGKESFLVFSNQRAVVSSSSIIDLPMKYAPYKHFGLLLKFLKK